MRRTKKQKKVDSLGVAHILITFNNIIVTITDLAGNTICNSSAGALNFRGSRKGTAYAAQKAAEQACNRAKEIGVKRVDIKLKGSGSGRESAIRSIYKSGLNILSIEDRTPIPHNGCRARKKRRL